MPNGGKTVLSSHQDRGTGRGGGEASRVAENPGGGSQGVGGGVESPQGIDTPGVEELPRGGETSGVTPKRDKVPGGGGSDGGREGTNPPTTQETNACGDRGGDKGLTGGPELAAPPHPQRGTAAGDSTETPYKHPDGANSARPKHGALAHRKYSSLAPADPASNPVAAETQVSSNSHKATETEDQAQRETGDGTRQCVLLPRGMPEDANKERGPPNDSKRLMRAATKGGKGGGGSTSSTRLLHAAKVQRGTPATAAHTPSVRPGDRGGGGPPHPAARATHTRAG